MGVPPSYVRAQTRQEESEGRKTDSRKANIGDYQFKSCILCENAGLLISGSNPPEFLPQSKLGTRFWFWRVVRNRDLCGV